MNRLELLNERRVSLGKPALKSWKGSKAKLEEAITALGHAVPTTEAKPAPTAKPLPRIARSLGIDPKAARAALRKIHGPKWRQLTEEELRVELASRIAALTPA